MTVKYNYECSECKETYLEQRAAEEPQFVVTCQACFNGQYVETSVEVISEIVERTTTPEIIEEPTV